MREEGLNSIAYSKNVIEFITVANEFCSFLERSDDLETPIFLGRLQKILPLLYLKASLLPEFEFEAEDDMEKFVTEIDYNMIQEKVLQHTGGNDDYQEVFISGMQFSESALTSNISENVADIYQEMKDLVMSFRMLNDEVMEQAVWECKNNFASLWGQTLVNCLRAVHNLIYAENNEEDQHLAKKDKTESKNKTRKPDWLNDRFSNQGE
ncbi:MAG TPA: DUF5063 domain-containing protein [Prolixibacteraceae bacterium]|jgi:hypothetical protein|nr:DUF5063 domain-containing protein [Prolixibacteraceae bacterium]